MGYSSRSSGTGYRIGSPNRWVSLRSTHPARCLYPRVYQLIRYASFSAALLFAILFIAALMSITFSRRQSHIYTILICNRTFEEKSDVGVYFDGRFAAAAGNMVQGGLKGFTPVRLSLPEKAEVRWRDTQGVKSVMVPILGADKSRLDDCLLAFIIEEGDVVNFTYVAPDDQEKENSISISLVPFRRK
jgi:hypothetical protein